MKKKFGQNFLINQSVVKKIIETCNINLYDEILEIGLGDGVLTKEIIKKKPNKFVALEIDESLSNKLQSIFSKNKNNNYELIFTDALKFDESCKFKKNFKIISNLPYNISLPLLFKWIDQLKKFPFANKMILMFQKEVAERILANTDSKKYGRISILCSTFYNIKKIIDVDKKNFFPIPKVDSTVLCFDILKKSKIEPGSIEFLKKISFELFNNRRKKLKKKIQSLFTDDIIKNNALDKFYDLRAENLTVDIFCKLALLLKQKLEL
jgi:16S rRNA (adenine1518-N6/adenine1519-N6)-dimethyltransferase